MRANPSTQVVMAKLSIIIAPDPRLNVTAGAVDSVDETVRTLIDDLLETMYAAPGVGLAAPQVGVAKRVIVVDCAERDAPRAPLAMVNPELLWTSNEVIVAQEGCLSLPDQFADVERSHAIRARYLDRDNETRELEAEGLLATCVQHEMDHLDGVLFVDRISRLKRGMILRKLVKTRKLDAAESAETAPVL
jgi:peptide deformylase